MILSAMGGASGQQSDEIGIETIQLMLVMKYIVIDHVAETLTAVAIDEDTPLGRIRGTDEAGDLIARARARMCPMNSDMMVRLSGCLIRWKSTPGRWKRSKNISGKACVPNGSIPAVDD